MALVQEQFPDSRALANGVYLSINFAIRSIAAVVYGAAGDAFGLSTAMLIGDAAPRPMSHLLHRLAVSG